MGQWQHDSRGETFVPQHLVNRGCHNPAALLAKISKLIDSKSQTQHQLAREIAILREAATRLRLGCSSEATLVTLQHIGGWVNGYNNKS